MSAGDRVLTWNGDQLIGLHASNGELAFATGHAPLGEIESLRPCFRHERFALVKAAGVLEVVDCDTGVVVNRYTTSHGVADASMIGGQLVAATSFDVRFFDDSVFIPKRRVPNAAGL